MWSRGGRTRRPDVGRRLSPQPETQHPPVGGEVLIGLVASRLRRPDQTPSGSVGVGHHHNPHGATDQPARRAKPSAPRSDDRGSKPPPTVPDRSREVKVHYGRAEFATFGGGGVDRRRRGGIQSRARPSPPVPRASCVASRAANRRSALPSPFRPKPSGSFSCTTHPMIPRARPARRLEGRRERARQRAVSVSVSFSATVGVNGAWPSS